GGSALNGGGVFNSGTATLTSCTISGNSANQGGGLYNQGTARLANTIVAGNTGNTGPDVSGTFTSQGHDLIGLTAGSSGWAGSDLTGTDPLLAPLGNYGGPTQTMALLHGSPAIDAGSNVLLPGGSSTDQRGQPRIFNATVDIGAFESAIVPSFVVTTTTD